VVIPSIRSETLHFGKNVPVTVIFSCLGSSTAMFSSAKVAANQIEERALNSVVRKVSK